MGPDKFGTGPLRDLIRSIPKRSHKGSPKVFKTARPFTWDRIIPEMHLVVEDERPPKR